MILHEQTFWLAAWALYLLANVKFLKRSEGLIFVSLQGRPIPLLPENPIEAVFGVICLMNPFVPHRVVFRCAWGGAEEHVPHDVGRAWSEIRRLTRQMSGARVIAAISWAALLVAGPVATYLLGLAGTLLLLAPVWLALIAATAYLLLAGACPRGDRSPGLILFECAVCPAYLAALPRLLACGPAINVDLCRIVERYGDAATWQALQRSLERRIEAEIFHDPDAAGKLESYRAAMLK